MNLTVPYRVFLLFFALIPSFVYAETLGDVQILLESWQLDEAVRMAEDLYQSESETPESQYALGLARFYQGKYPEALTLVDKALAAKRYVPKEWKAFRGLVDSTSSVLSSHQEMLSPKGHFLFRYLPRDAVLLPYAAQALDAAYEALGEDFDLYPTGPIPVEFYPSAKALAQVSTLSESEIKDSGTIALCKFNRLMVTSPRALLQGYNWLDTLAHEYVHYLVSVTSENTVPIWLHEGLAKFYEQRWRGSKQGKLPPSQEQILVEALKRGHLITFDQMHPSMAKLPSQDDTALAFAEVFMAVEYLQNSLGQVGIRKLLSLLRDGEAVENAISAATGLSFSAFLKDWTRYMKEKKIEDRPGLVSHKLVFKTDLKNTPKTDPAESETRKISKEAKKYFRLGELLLAQGKSRAAVVELEKAKKLDKKGYGLALQMKLARAYLAAAAYPSASLTAEGVVSLYPEYVGGWLVAGRALLAQEDYKKAKKFLLEAVRLNPFDPNAHKDLLQAGKALGETDLIAQEKEALKALKS